MFASVITPERDLDVCLDIFSFALAKLKVLLHDGSLQADA